MSASDDENDSDESESYAIESPEIAYTNETTIEEMIRDALANLLKKGRVWRELGLHHLRDLVDLIEANPDDGLLTTDTLEEIELPDGWTSEADDESE